VVVFMRVVRHAPPYACRESANANAAVVKACYAHRTGALAREGGLRVEEIRYEQRVQ